MDGCGLSDCVNDAWDPRMVPRCRRVAENGAETRIARTRGAALVAEGGALKPPQNADLSRVAEGPGIGARCGEE